MSRLFHTNGNKALSAITIAMLLLVAVVPAAAISTEKTLSFMVEQVFTTTSASAEGTFSYRLEPLKAGNPLPPGSSADGYTFTITGDGHATVGPIGYIAQGVYEYKLYQVADEPKMPGYTYDERVYTIEVYVNDTPNVIIIARNEDSIKTAQLVFQSAYGVLPSDPNLMPDPPVKKTVSGNPGSDSSFEFRLVAMDIANPMPEGSADGAKTITVVGQGQGAFGTWSYSNAGVYHYAVHEVNGGLDGYTYDTAVYSITDTVYDGGGRLVLSRVVMDSMGMTVTDLAFVNIYSPGADPTPVPTATPGGGGTGPGGSSTPRPTSAPATPTPAPATASPTPAPPSSKPTSSPRIRTPGGVTSDDRTSMVGDDMNPFGAGEFENNATPAPPAYDGGEPTRSELVQDNGPPSSSSGRTNQGGIGPKTGDETNIALLVTMLAIGGALALGAAIYMLAFRKRRRA